MKTYCQLSIRLDEGLAKRLDTFCKEQSISKTSFVVKAIECALGERDEQPVTVDPDTAAALRRMEARRRQVPHTER